MLRIVLTLILALNIGQTCAIAQGLPPTTDPAKNNESLVEPLKPLIQDSNSIKPSIKAPEWSEFCPSQYLDAELGPVRKFPTFGDILLSLTIVGSPLTYSHRDAAVHDLERNYWAKRHKQFLASVSTCESGDANTQSLCFTQIRQLEFNKTATMNSQITQNQILQQMRIQTVQNSRPKQINCYSNGNGYTTCN